ncbi:MAG: amidohydrolase [Dysgonamonadaceae bacterium]|nr:amidohydrolase [Dysgonamonadaceae bacterium]
MNLSETIKRETDALFPEIVQHYRYLHQHPELSHQEKTTNEYITRFLDAEGIAYRNNIGGYGVLAHVRGEAFGSNRTIAFCADMDALPIEEENEVSYKSVNRKVMHACGHDAQTASLMGAAKLINRYRKDFGGTVLFVFQPAEEQSPGGADLMLKDGVFRDFNPEFIVKQHAYVDLHAGKVAFQTGTIMASADEVHIKVKGRGGHGALPHELNDTVLAASNIIVAMQQIVSRRRNPFNPMVLSFGKFIADGATNVIPNEVTLAGSLRCMNEEDRRIMLEIIPQVANSTAEAYGCKCEVTLPEGYPCTINDGSITEEVKSVAIELIGEENVTDFPKRMTADDFGFFTANYNACYYRFGVAGKGDVGKLHTSTFLIDEESLRTSTGLFTLFGVKIMQEQR